MPIYMTAVQIYNEASGRGRSGGWPMSVFLTPDAQPFFGGTYLPARDGDRGTTTGFLTCCTGCRSYGRHNVKASNRLPPRSPSTSRRNWMVCVQQCSVKLNAKLYAEAPNGLQERFDPDFGGFGFVPENPAVPKFPEPSNLLFLTHVLQRDDLEAPQRDAATKMLVRTLEQMSLGGMRDHIGGGFHRYSVDRYWRIPHFRKDAVRQWAAGKRVCSCLLADTTRGLPPRHR